ncbi:MAG: hypothetical protein NXI04_00850 [Planctomycetaceae bacterium]|nr:hypothetical protein [Planctomycetaceae bacterium]
MKLFSALLVLVSGSVSMAAGSSLCPFCDAPSLTMSEQVGQSAHLLLAQWIGGEKPTSESAGTAVFRIVDVARSEDDLFKAEMELELPQYIVGKEELFYVLMGPGTRLVDWHVPAPATKSAWEYVAQLPPLETEPEKQIERLAYFLDYLQHPELMVSNDAYAEFAAAPYEIITPLKDRMPREDLRKWLLDPSTPVTRIGLYGLLLGLCGQEEDAKAMERKIMHPQSEFRLGIEGVMSGYLLIRGEAGLEFLEENKMHAETYVDASGEEKKVPFSEVYATMQTLRFMWTYEPDRIDKQRLKESMRSLLERPELADLVIADLARWKDWGVQDRLMAMYEEEDFQIPSIKRAIVRYFFYCSKDVPRNDDGTTGEPPAWAVSAAEHLTQLEEKDPKTVRDARRYLVR